MVALEVEIEDDILCGIQCLASLAEPVAAVALCQLDNLGTDVFQESFSLLFAKNIEYIVQYVEENVVISAESHLLICRCRAHDVTVEIRLTLVGYTQKVSKLVGIGGRIIVGENISIQRKLTEERPMLPVTPDIELRGVNTIVLAWGCWLKGALIPSL